MRTILGLLIFMTTFSAVAVEVPETTFADIKKEMENQLSIFIVYNTGMEWFIVHDIQLSSVESTPVAEGIDHHLLYNVGMGSDSAEGILYTRECHVNVNEKNGVWGAAAVDCDTTLPEDQFKK